MRKPWVWITAGIVIGIAIAMIALTSLTAVQVTGRERPAENRDEREREKRRLHADWVASRRQVQQCQELLEVSRRVALLETGESSDEAVVSARLDLERWQTKVRDLEHESWQRFGVPASELP